MMYLTNGISDSQNKDLVFHILILALFSLLLNSSDMGKNTYHNCKVFHNRFKASNTFILLFEHSNRNKIIPV